MSQGVAEIEDLRRRLEVAEMELKLVLEGSRVQKEVEISTEESSVEKALTNGADEDAVQNSHRSGRKSHRGLVFFLASAPPHHLEKDLVEEEEYMKRTIVLMHLKSLKTTYI